MPAFQECAAATKLGNNLGMHHSEVAATYQTKPTGYHATDNLGTGSQVRWAAHFAVLFHADCMLTFTTIALYQRAPYTLAGCTCMTDTLLLPDCRYHSGEAYNQERIPFRAS